MSPGGGGCSTACDRVSNHCRTLSKVSRHPHTPQRLSNSSPRFFKQFKTSLAHLSIIPDVSTRLANRRRHSSVIGRLTVAHVRRPLFVRCDIAYKVILVQWFSNILVSLPTGNAVTYHRYPYPIPLQLCHIKGN